jgi:hypothetical protein
MPKGVEHLFIFDEANGIEPVNASRMPKGVEH